MSGVLIDFAHLSGLVLDATEWDPFGRLGWEHFHSVKLAVGAYH